MQTTGSGEDGEVRAEWRELDAAEAAAMMAALAGMGATQVAGVTGEEVVDGES